MRNNALWNCKNPNQGDSTKVLCICSAGLLRSPTMAAVLIKKGFNARAAGMHDYALIEVDHVLLKWADVVLFAEEPLMEYCLNKFPDNLEGKVYHCLKIPDMYQYGDPKLIKIIEERLEGITFDTV